MPALAILAVAACLAAPPDQQLMDRVRRLLAETPLIDGHNDVPWRYRERFGLSLDSMDFAGDLSGLDPHMATDLGRLRQGGVGAQFWSVYIPVPNRGGSPGDARLVIEQMDFVKQMCARYPSDLEMACTAEDVVRIHGAGRIACLLGMEGGHSIEDSLAVLRATYALGARYMTLTHTKNTRWCDSATDDAEFGGLSDFGREVVREMNRLGMLVDLSHVSAEAMHDALDVSTAPVIFSHSGAFEICRHVRNVPDDVLKRLPANGGVVMAVFLPGYVSEALRLWEVRRAAEKDPAAWEIAMPPRRAALSQVADHIEYIRGLIGIDHVGIGSDFDGTRGLPEGLEDVSKFPDLLVELLRRGWSDQDLRQLMGLNVLRVMRRAEAVAQRQADPASEAPR
jgi:membrane dipeptidase